MKQTKEKKEIKMPKTKEKIKDNLEELRELINDLSIEELYELAGCCEDLAKALESDEERN